MGSVDSSTSHVILIGTSECVKDLENLPPLPAVKRNIEKLSEIFRDSSIIKLHNPTITTLLNPGSVDDLGESIVNIAREAFDTLILYYAGHGIKASQSRGLFLATTKTTEANCQYNGFNFDIIRHAVNESPAKVKILIIDSCFSGEIAGDEMGSAKSLLASNMELRGTYSIASSPANRKSIARTGAEYTAFSGILIDVLTNGVSSGGEELTIEDVYREVERIVLAQPELPRPQRRVMLDGDKIPIARNKWKKQTIETRFDGLEGTVEKMLARLDELAERTPSSVRLPQVNAAEEVSPEFHMTSVVDQLIFNTVKSVLLFTPILVSVLILISVFIWQTPSSHPLGQWFGLFLFSVPPGSLFFYLFMLYISYRSSRFKIPIPVLASPNFGPRTISFICVISLVIWFLGFAVLFLAIATGTIR